MSMKGEKMYNNFDMSIKLSRLIKNISESKGIPISKLENDIGIKRGYLTRCTSGKKRLSIDMVNDICIYFGLDIETLINAI